MRKLWWAVAAVLLFAGVQRPAEATHSAPVDSWIVTLAPGVDPLAEARVLAAAAGGTVGHIYTNVLGGFSFVGTSLSASLLAANPLVASVVPDGPVHLAQTSPAQIVPTGVSRISAPAAHAAGSTGAGAVVAVIDSGIDLVHPDLMANLHPTLGANCSQPLLPPVDDNSHGTHVAGTIAAADNGVGVVGVAPAAQLVPVKAFDAAGESTWSIVICGIDYVAAHASEIDVANMSFGDLSTEATACDGVTTSDIDALRQAVCDLVDAGVVPVAASGNNMIDVAGFVPASFPEVVTVSALTDFDGAPGGAGGCIVFGALCDDSYASLFSNYGTRVDVMAPGFEILSTMPGGLYGLKDGTSMAAPHASGAAALVLAASPGLSVADVRTRLQETGECPDRSAAGADAGCAGQGAWALDPDAEAEPLLNAAAAAVVVVVDEPPSAAVASPAAGSSVSGVAPVSVAASDDNDAAGTLAVSVRVNGGAWSAAAWDGTSYAWSWDTRPLANGPFTLEAQAVDSNGGTTVSAPVGVTVFNGMHVGSLAGSAAVGKKSWTAKVTVSVHGPTHALVDGAVVTLSWSGGASGTASCTTSRKGVCTVTSTSLAYAVTSVTATVTSVSRSGQAYTAGANHVSAVTVTR